MVKFIITSNKMGKTESWCDLLKWIGKLPKSGKKERTSENIDKIAYDLSR